MFGLGVLKGLGITLKHFVDSYVDDFKYMYAPGRTRTGTAMAARQGPEARGLFTVEYPEVKLKTPENFRFLPFLVTDFDVAKDSPDYDWAKAKEANRCTSCGICAKVCPPQCIWIVRTDDPKTGKPIPQPAEFYIDTDICMNCGYCAEFCPFDAIKMDHDFELADFEREHGHVHDLARLLKPISYYAAIRPTWNAKEEAARRAAEEEKERKAAEKAAAAAAAKTEAVPPPAPVAAAPAVAPAVAGEVADKPAASKRTPEEIKAQREAMLAKKQQRQTEGGEAEAESKAEAAAPAAAVSETPPAPAKRSPEEIKAQREAMMAQRAARAAGVSPAAEAEAVAPAAAVTGVAATAAQAEPPAPAVEAAAPSESALPAREVETSVAALEASAAAHLAEVAATPAAPDDLQVIEGIGPKIAKTLNNAGITTFAQLAATEASRLEQLLVEANLRRLADPATWPEQAKLAAANDWDGLKTLQAGLKGGRRVS